MGVIQPYVNGMGGDLFAHLLRSQNRQTLRPQLQRLDAQSPHHRLPEGQTASQRSNPIGVDTIDVPGAVAGWDAMRTRFGTMPFPDSSPPPSTTPRTDFPSPNRNARYWVSQGLLKQPGYKETYMPDGERPKPGDVFKNPALANSLRQVAEHGRDAYYNGA